MAPTLERPAQPGQHSQGVQQKLGGALKGEPLPLLERLPALPLVAQVQRGHRGRRGRRLRRREQRQLWRRLSSARLLGQRRQLPRPLLRRRLPRRRPAPTPGLARRAPCATGAGGRGGGRGGLRGPGPFLPAWLRGRCFPRLPHGSRSLARRQASLPARPRRPARSRSAPRAPLPANQPARPGAAAPARPDPGFCPPHLAAAGLRTPESRQLARPPAYGVAPANCILQAKRDRASRLGYRHEEPVCTCRGTFVPSELKVAPSYLPALSSLGSSPEFTVTSKQAAWGIFISKMRTVLTLKEPACA